jgi:methyl-accepting chemotaxis protein
MLGKLSIAQRLWFISILSGSLFFVAVAIGWFGLQSAEKSLKTVYEDRAIPLRDLGEMRAIIQENNANVLLGFQHDPAGSVASVHDHPLSVHTNMVRDSKSKLDGLWEKYMATYLTEEEKALAADFVDKRKAWVTKMLAAVSALENGDYSPATLAAFLQAGREERKACNGCARRSFELPSDRGTNRV